MNWSFQIECDPVKYSVYGCLILFLFVVYKIPPTYNLSLSLVLLSLHPSSFFLPRYNYVYGGWDTFKLPISGSSDKHHSLTFNSRALKRLIDLLGVNWIDLSFLVQAGMSHWTYDPFMIHLLMHDIFCTIQKKWRTFYLLLSLYSWCAITPLKQVSLVILHAYSKNKFHF